MVVSNIVKEQIESKSQLKAEGTKTDIVVSNIVKEQIESKSQPVASFTVWILRCIKYRQRTN